MGGGEEKRAAEQSLLVGLEDLDRVDEWTERTRGTKKVLLCCVAPIDVPIDVPGIKVPRKSTLYGCIPSNLCMLCMVMPVYVWTLQAKGGKGGAY